MNRKKKIKKRVKPRQSRAAQRAPLKPQAGELWIEPDLNRKIAGPGGNRAEHTTSSAELLKLADIALRKRA